MSSAIIKLQNLSKTFKSAAGEVRALSDMTIEIEQGDVFGIIGMSSGDIWLSLSL